MAPHAVSLPKQDTLLSIKDARERLHCSRSRIYSMIGAGDLPAYKEGNRTVFRSSDLDAYLANLKPAKIGAASRRGAK